MERLKKIITEISFLEEKVVLVFIGIFNILIWLVDILGAATHTDHYVFHIMMAIACFCVVACLDSSHFVKKHIESIILVLASFFSVYHAFEIYFFNYSENSLFQILLFVTIISGYLSSYYKLAVFFIINFLSLSLSLLSLPPGLVPFNVWNFIALMPPTMMAFAFVITNGVRTRKRLVESEQKLQQKATEINGIFDALPFKISYKDCDNRFVQVNKGTANLFKKSAEELEGKSLYDIFPKEIAARYHDEDKEVIQTREPLIGLINEVIIPETNEKIWLKSHKIPRFNEKGEVIGVIAYGEDVSDQVLSKKKLYAIEQRFRNVFEHAPGGMILMRSFDSPFINANSSAQNLLGYPAREIAGFNFNDILHPEDKTAFYSKFDLNTLKDDCVFKEEVRFINADGIELSVSLTLNQIEENDSEKLIFAVFRDITGRKEDEKRLKKYAKQLEDSNQSLQEFAYAASHDLREPLRTIISYIQLLDKRLPEEHKTQDINEFMHFIVDGSKRMEKLIFALLEFSKVGRGELKFEKTTAADVIHTACASMGQLIRESETTIEFEELPDLVVDSDQLRLLFQNLISNAIKYRKKEEPMVIKISATVEQNEILFAVSDNGIGIKEEYLEQIFAVFRRLHSHGNIPGTGVGLSICRRIVERHGGLIWASSTFGVGTTIYFSLQGLKPECRMCQYGECDSSCCGTFSKCSESTELNGWHASSSNGDNFSKENAHLSGKHLKSLVSAIVRPTEGGPLDSDPDASQQ